MTVNEELQKQLNGAIARKARLGNVFLDGLAVLPPAHRDAILSWIDDVDDRRFVDDWLAKVDRKHK